MYSNVPLFNPGQGIPKARTLEEHINCQMSRESGRRLIHIINIMTTSISFGFSTTALPISVFQSQLHWCFSLSFSYLEWKVANCMHACGDKIPYAFMHDISSLHESQRTIKTFVLYRRLLPLSNRITIYLIAIL